LSATEPLKWNDGRLLTLSAGQAAKCETLVTGQLYAVLLYNTSQIDVDAIVTVVWSNSVPPSKVTVHGSTGDGAAAYFVFVSGTDTNFISISLSPEAAATITAFIVSVSMPSNTEGLNNAELPNSGQFQSFNKYDRYYMEPATGWRSVYIQNKVTQFICLQMVQTKATVIVVNMGSGLADGQVTVFGPTAKGDGAVIIDKIDYQNYHMDIQEN
jgi:hypothetical protein